LLLSFSLSVQCLLKYQPVFPQKLTSVGVGEELCNIHVGECCKLHFHTFHLNFSF